MKPRLSSVAHLGIALCQAVDVMTTPRDPSDAAAVETARKVGFLATPHAYPGDVRQVDVHETHMSWVFLTERRVFKMKKPVRYPFLDYGTLDRREAMCRAEVHWNRRLAPWVYRGVVPLVLDPAGELELGGRGAVVEWLVEMERLPADRLLDRALMAGAVEAVELERALGHLVAFYRASRPVPLAPETYLTGLRREIAQTQADLEAAGVRVTAVRQPAAALRHLLDDRGVALEERVAAGRLRDGHGDLRPEHVFLGEPAAIIDCIEFDPRLRLLDTVDEIAFLAMETARLGQEGWGTFCLEAYCRLADDPVPEEIVLFHMCRRALLRAKLAIWHLRDGRTADVAKWRGRTEDYLELANAYGRRL